jgi:hypothetical protein
MKYTLPTSVETLRKNVIVPTISLHVSGYKSIGESATLNVRPMTLISGANSSGKSSFMQPFLMIKQTLDAQFDPGPILLNGANVKLTDWSQALSRKKARSSTTRALELGILIGTSGILNKYEWGPRKGLNLAATSYLTRKEKPRSFVDKMSPKEVEALFSRETINLARGLSSSAAKEYSKRNPQASRVATPPRFYTERSGCFIMPKISLQGGFDLTLNDPNAEFSIKSIDELIRGIIHIPGLRGNPERTYTSSAPGQNFPGLMEQYIASVIYGWENGTAEEKKHLSTLSADLEKLGLTWKIHAARIDDVRIQLQVGRLLKAQQGGAFDLVNLADVGFGVSQVLPILVALRVAQPGQVVYMEQPELHLHPRAQMELGDLLVNAAKRGVRVIAETHSSLIIRSIQSSVARGNISPDDVALNWFSRDPETGNTSIDQAEIDRYGRFGEWPMDFDEVAEESDFEFLTAVEEAIDEHE